MTPHVALTVAGTDPTGRAGIAADLRAFAGVGVHGAAVVAAVTVQDSTGVTAVSPLAPGLVVAQIEAVLGDLPLGAAKTGLLASPDVVEAVASVAARMAPLVVDPVLTASTGGPLTAGDVVGAYRRHLLPLAAVVTPNLAEASALTGRPVTGVAQAAEAARALVDTGCGSALVTGGHAENDEPVDVFYDGEQLAQLRIGRVPTRNDRGTGCTHSAALAARLARGEGLLEAATSAQRDVADALGRAAGWTLGRGAGPVDPLGLGLRLDRPAPRPPPGR